VTIPTTYAIRFADGRLDVIADEVWTQEYAREFPRSNHPSARNKRRKYLRDHLRAIQIDDIIDVASDSPRFVAQQEIANRMQEQVSEPACGAPHRKR